MSPIGLAAELAEMNDEFMENFGGSIIYTPSGGSALPAITGMFIYPHNEVTINGALYYSQNYMAIVRTEDVSSPTQGDTVTIEDVVYTIIGWELGQTNLTTLELQT